MAANLQQLVESLARRLGRSVAIDNRLVQLLAYSPHETEVDPARAGSILRREVPKAVVDHVYASGAGEADGLFTVDARTDLGLEDPRVGHTIIHQGRHLGFLWLLASEGPLPADQHETVRRAAEDAGLLMHRAYLQKALASDRERELLTRLLSESEELREAASAEILEDGLFSGGSFSALVVEIERPDRQISDADRLALASGLGMVRSQRQTHHVLTLERRDHAVLIVAEPLGDSARDELVALGNSLRDAVLAVSGAESCWVGIGRSRQNLAHAFGSYDEALRTTSVCRQVRVLAPVTTVESLGVFELLSHVPDEVLRTTLHPGLRELLEQQSSSNSLLQTLHVFLSAAGDVKSASEELFIHRTSLYYRLRRIQDLTGLDLSNGDDVLAAHLSLMIARQLGLF